MAGNSNSGSFRDMNAKKHKKISSEGGNASTGSFGEANSADPSAAGKKGAANQPTEAKRRGGENSHSNS